MLRPKGRMRTDASADESFIIQETGRQIQIVKHRRDHKQAKVRRSANGLKRGRTESKNEGEIKLLTAKRGTNAWYSESSRNTLRGTMRHEGLK